MKFYTQEQKNGENNEFWILVWTLKEMCGSDFGSKDSGLRCIEWTLLKYGRLGAAFKVTVCVYVEIGYNQTDGMS